MDIIDFVTKLKDFQNTYEHEENLLPYHFNVIDELHADENAHSRILQKILQYNQDGAFPFLHSFLTNFLSEAPALSTPSITFNQENIDVLIEDQSAKFACIIENKIHWAIDQDAQIERYIKTVQKHGIEYIFVIYLTRDGHKQIADYSLTDNAKEVLKYNSVNDTGNFICLNYREHILPWLKHCVLSNCPDKEAKMIPAIVQYIDHLEGLFNIREDKKKMNKELITKIRELFDIKGATAEDFKRIAECQVAINEFQQELNNLNTAMIKQSPWNQPRETLKKWIAQELKREFTEQASQFPVISKVWIWKEEVFVLEIQHYGYNFALDISCGNLAGEGASIALRGNFSHEDYKNICAQRFSKTFNDQQGWAYQENWRYYKKYSEIGNDEELNSLKEDLKDFLRSLK